MMSQNLQSPASGLVWEPILISEIMKICQQSQIIYYHDMKTQIICYMRFKYIEEILAESLNCYLYHVILKH